MYCIYLRKRSTRKFQQILHLDETIKLCPKKAAVDQLTDMADDLCALAEWHAWEHLI